MAYALLWNSKKHSKQERQQPNALRMYSIHLDDKTATLRRAGIWPFISLFTLCKLTMYLCYQFVLHPYLTTSKYELA